MTFTNAAKLVAAHLRSEGYNAYPSNSFPEADVATVVKSAPGGGVTPTMGDKGRPAWRQDGIQLIVRGVPTDHDECRTRAEEIWDLLAFSSPGASKAIRPQGVPIDIGTDDNSRPRYSINFLVEFYE